ncbi:MAG: hypothetical protein IT562_13005 [Alphaproteobacteria bacterium]|nr:hypothetical protein [Alphaproteobacteria bacterium]
MILNKSVGDFLWTWGSELVIGPRVRSFMAEHRFTGYELIDVHARFRKPSYGVPPPLWEIKVLGWGGMASLASGLALTDSCTSCGLLEYRVDDSSRLIDPDRWDGSDLFMVWPLPLFIFLSDHAAKSIRQAKFTGIRIEPAEELDLSDDPTFTPGRLSDHMPAVRARELGARLGID